MTDISNKKEYSLNIDKLNLSLQKEITPEKQALIIQEYIKSIPDEVHLDMLCCVPLDQYIYMIKQVALTSVYLGIEASQLASMFLEGLCLGSTKPIDRPAWMLNHFFDNPIGSDLRDPPSGAEAILEALHAVPAEMLAKAYISSGATDSVVQKEVDRLLGLGQEEEPKLSQSKEPKSQDKEEGKVVDIFEKRVLH